MDRVFLTYTPIETIYDAWEDCEYVLNQCICKKPQIQLQKGVCDEKLQYWIICLGCHKRTASYDTAKEAVTAWDAGEFDTENPYGGWYQNYCNNC